VVTMMMMKQQLLPCLHLRIRTIRRSLVHLVCSQQLVRYRVPVASACLLCAHCYCQFNSCLMGFRQRYIHHKTQEHNAATSFCTESRGLTGKLQAPHESQLHIVHFNISSRSNLLLLNVSRSPQLLCAIPRGRQLRRPPPRPMPTRL
jgi:hypothetical protein